MTPYLEFECPRCGWQGTEPTKNEMTGKRRCPECGARVTRAFTL